MSTAPNPVATQAAPAPKSATVTASALVVSHHPIIKIAIVGIIL